VDGSCYSFVHRKTGKRNKDKNKEKGSKKIKVKMDLTRFKGKRWIEFDIQTFIQYGKKERVYHPPSSYIVPDKKHSLLWHRLRELAWYIIHAPSKEESNELMKTLPRHTKTHINKLKVNYMKRLKKLEEIEKCRVNRIKLKRDKRLDLLSYGRRVHITTLMSQSMMNDLPYNLYGSIK